MKDFKSKILHKIYLFNRGAITMRYLFLLLFFVGCVKVQHNKVNEETLVDYPELNKEVRVNIGDHLVKKGLMVNETVLVLKKLVSSMTYKISPGEYVQVGDNKEFLFFVPTGIQRVLGDPPEALAVKKIADGYLYVITTFGGKGRYKAEYELKKRVASKVSSFQQTLIFNGLIGNKLNIAYREFSNDTARPAFNNNVEYDLSTSKTIGYKGCKLEVIKADNESITYKVIKNFD